MKTNFPMPPRICSEPNWNSKKEILKMRFPVLTDADLLSPVDEDRHMMRNLAVTLGLTPDQLEIVILTS